MTTVNKLKYMQLGTKGPNRNTQIHNLMFNLASEAPKLLPGPGFFNT